MHHISPASVFAVISGVYMDVGVYVSMHALEWICMSVYSYLLAYLVGINLS